MTTAGKIKLRKNDTVRIIAGREKGKSGRIIRIDREKMRAVVEGLNMAKKAVKRGILFARPPNKDMSRTCAWS